MDKKEIEKTAKFWKIHELTAEIQNVLALNPSELHYINDNVVVPYLRLHQRKNEVELDFNKVLNILTQESGFVDTSLEKFAKALCAKGKEIIKHDS